MGPTSSKENGFGSEERIQWSNSADSRINFAPDADGGDAGHISPAAAD